MSRGGPTLGTHRGGASLVGIGASPGSANDPPPDPEQVAAAAAVEGGVLLLAPVGSGKTRVLADRVVEAVRRGTDAGRVLCVTFTNRAADEMRGRIRGALPPAAERPHVSTFHALCARILRREHRALGLPPDFVVLDEDDTADLLVEAGAPPRNLEPYREDLARCKGPLDVDAPDPRLSLDAGPADLFADVDERGRDALVRYQRLLADRQALDFGDLVRLARALFREGGPAARAWGGRFDLVQVDEVQDVHHGEYEVVRHLARRSGNLALVGDPDQTIYGWRGSDPAGVLAAFSRDFAPVREVSLRWNHRATRRLVDAANAVLELPGEIPGGRRARVEPSPSLEEGEPLLRHDAPDAGAEAEWVAAEVARHARDAGVPWGRIGILCRTNARARRVGEALARGGVPHVTVEEFEFFRRREVKDATALLRLLQRPDDASAADRALRRPPRGFGDAAIADFRREGAPCGLRLSDALSHAALVAGEPFAPLLSDLREGSLVVLDVETTGLDPGRDQVVEVGAVRLDAGAEAATFHALVRPTRPLGASSAVHGIDEDLLLREGRPAADVLRDLAAFVGDRAVAGHNAPFDVSFLEAQAEACGAPLRFGRVEDTLRIVRRLRDLPRYDLATCLAHLGIPAGRAHRALDDARATAALLTRLADDLRPGSLARAALMARVPEPVRALAASLDALRGEARTSRPGDLLRSAVETSGLLAHAEAEPRRGENLREYERILRRRDRPGSRPADALREALLFASLAKNVSMEVADDSRVPVVTVHQAKGLEFDAVFVVGAVEGEFPHFRSRREGGERLAEERRLFYVAVTRARRRLYVSTHAAHDRGFSRRASPYLSALFPEPVDAPAE